MENSYEQPFGVVSDADISGEMRASFIDYAMSIIVSRALPDVRDGLKPVHRRILYAMRDLGLTPDKPFRKCARIVGEVLGKYHPHGDVAVYDALVRLAQPFSSRYKLVDGHGNFGSLDDNPAAMRYTEARMASISTELLADIDAETVDFQDNFDGSLKEPVVLPAKVPTLLINGSSGIAVGMATNIPPHNLSEVVDGIVHLIDDPEATVSDLMRHVRGPDFPSGGVIRGHQGIRDAFETGKGSVTVRAVAEIEDLGRQQAIVVRELPYLVGPESLIAKIADLVKSEKLTGIADLNDESSRKGTRVVVKLKRDANADVVLNNLYKYTQLQQNFAVNTLALVNGRPHLLNLKQVLAHFLEHRVEVVRRKAQHDLNKAQEREHIVRGLLHAIGNLEEIIALIRAAASTEEARTGLQEKFELSEPQANAILDMQLRRLTALETDKLRNEQQELLTKIERLQKLLASRELVLGEIREDLVRIRKAYGDTRKTLIEAAADGDMSEEDLIANDSMMVFITAQDYIKRIPTESFSSQTRAGRGRKGLSLSEADDLKHCLSARMHDELMFFTTRGVVYTEKVHRVPEGSRQTKGKPLVNVAPLLPEENVTAVIDLSKADADDRYLIMLTLKGVIKKVAAKSFRNVRRSGIIAINLDEEDQLGWVKVCQPHSHLVLATRQGMVIRYTESELRALGRNATGVKSMSLHQGDEIVSFGIFDPAQESETYLLFVTEDGYGKRVLAREFRDQKRGGMGLIGLKFKRPTSRLAGLGVVSPEQEVVIATAQGVLMRQKAGDIPVQSRMATGVRLQQIGEGDFVTSVIPLATGDDAELEGATT